MGKKNRSIPGLYLLDTKHFLGLQTLTGAPVGEGCRAASSPVENYCPRVLDTPANLNLQEPVNGTLLAWYEVK